MTQSHEFLRVFSQFDEFEKYFLCYHLTVFKFVFFSFVVEMLQKMCYRQLYRILVAVKDF